MLKTYREKKQKKKEQNANNYLISCFKPYTDVPCLDSAEKLFQYFTPLNKKHFWSIPVMPFLCMYVDFVPGCTSRCIIKLRIDLFQCHTILFVLSLQKHMNNCPLGYVTCPNNCNLEVLRCDIDKHVKEECIKRIETCTYCLLKVVSKDMEVNSFVYIYNLSFDV